jgi:hypothetical protein
MTHFPDGLPVVPTTAIAPSGYLNGAAMESRRREMLPEGPAKTRREDFRKTAILDSIFRHKGMICTLRSGGLTFASDR